MRTFLMVVSILIMVFSGGCSLVFLLDGGMKMYLDAILVLGGVPFAVGLVIFLLARRMDKKP
ncbi:MAG: hypothetical protein GY952_02460 [Rhodobacteraceae bacterium]|nr:hypothetical protein [Paracoccaceae bacterium]